MIQFMKKLIYIFSLFFLSACSTQNPLTDFRFQTQVAPPYILASWYNISKIGEPLRIYIEGDGNSFDINGQPTENPTPRSVFLRDIAANDTNFNVAYLGRPCQYMQAGSCSVTDWTDGRFSSRVINSMNNAVNALMKKAQTNEVILIGYSGGAQIAGLISIQNKSVKKVITIAGVLDVDAWTEYHNDDKLNKSLNLKSYIEIFDKIPQIHYVGEKDDVVPPSLTRAFVKDDSKIIVVPKATHNKGYEKIYKSLYQQ